MIKRRRFPKIFPGWWIAIGGGCINLWAGGFCTYGFSALFKPIAAALHFSRAVTSTAGSMISFEGGFQAPLTGWVADRFGPRWIIFIGVFFVGLGLILMNFVNSLWAFLIVWGGLLGTAHNISGIMPLSTAVANWFVKKRGLALGIQLVFSALAGVLVLPLIAWLITIQGWRMTCVIGGVVMWLVGLPLAWFCLKQHRPEYYGLLPDGATVKEDATSADQMIDRGVKYAGEHEEVEFTLRQAMRTPAFWVLLASSAANGMAGPTINMHGIPFLTDRGIDPVKAASIFAMMIAVSIPVRLIGGFLADRVGKNHLRFIIVGAYLLEATGFAVFLLNQQSIAMIYVWFILYGIGSGVPMTLGGLMIARYFGRKAFGSIRGTSTMLITPVGMIAPIYVGWIYDTTGNYIFAFTLAAGLLVFSAILVAFALPPKPPAQITDIRKIV